MFTFHKATNFKSQGEIHNSPKLTTQVNFFLKRKRKSRKTFIITSKKIEIQYDYNKLLDKVVPWPLK